MNRKLRSFHRVIGAILASFLLMFAITGIALNHSIQLKLDKRYVSWDWLMSQYGIGEVKPDAAFLIDNKIFSQFGNQLFLDATPLIHIERPLLGGIALEDIIVLTTDDGLILLTREGEFIEKMGAEAGIPAPIQNIGLYHGEPVLQTRQSMWRSNFMLDKWEPISLQGVSWSMPHPLPQSVNTELKQFFYGKGISIQQLLLDIHNGHILGPIGIWLIDALSVLIIFLSLSGLWMWGRRLG
ncbi:MAG: PepSY-associated TM helix domain-containing protein [Pseudomonadota bacterium]|uniref:PepSY-associated TM helix domain-containing protein n=1 Tax=Methylophaga aminisulfidivorans TaxID=230105 RepID=UPI0024E22F61|nr:PepSY-associated TM helix domain-containing protein [Methylophaga aminisulfidivorans]MEC9412345.1 PepSY-associated TM helix domain-containing protein [Pseudomonadota bacterium]